MENLNHNGTSYIKASVLARKYRYTTDYIGQLCRQNKIEATLVGRAWFVNENSLVNHKVDRNKDTRPNEILRKNAVQMYATSDQKSEQVAVRSVLSKKTHRQFFDQPEVLAPVNHHWQNRTVAYSEDAATLVPLVTNKIIKSLVQAVPSEAAVAIPVTLGEAEKLTVQESSDFTRDSLIFSDLPEVSLRGDLNVTSLDTEDEFIDAAPVSLSDLPKPIVEPSESRSAIIRRYEKPVRKLTTTKIPVARMKEPIPGLSPIIPKAVVLVAASIPETVITPPLIQKTKRVRLLLPLLLIFSLIVATAMVSANTIIVSDGSVSKQSLTFTISSLEEALVYVSQTI